MSSPRTIAGIVLAGGLSSRMGGDKSLIVLGGRRLLDRAIERLRPQVEHMAVSANGNPARFGDRGLPFLPDPVPDHRGPLAGVLAGLLWAQELGLDQIATVPCDTPFYPNDLVARLALASEGHELSSAASAGRSHPVFGLWRAHLIEPLRQALAGDETGVGRFMARYRPGVAEWPAVPYDPFFNINTPADLAEGERVIAAFDP